MKRRSQVLYLFGYTLKRIQYSMVPYTGQEQNRIDSDIFHANFMPGLCQLDSLEKSVPAIPYNPWTYSPTTRY